MNVKQLFVSYVGNEGTEDIEHFKLKCKRLTNIRSRIPALQESDDTDNQNEDTID